ncbi:MAG: hypothetical protein LBQ88_06215 [Treponema sp.]|nr:hypothetical protein [Treponema sp.]
MKAAAIPVLILLFFMAHGTGHSLDANAYRSAFALNCLEAEAYVEDIKPLLFAALNDDFLTNIGIAVVFPELTRYSYIRDVAETTALELSYILGGDVDFSIGKMQMKPSFARQIEADAGELCRNRYPELFKNGKDEQAGRGLRILRLKNTVRQVEYLAVFLHIMTNKYPHLTAEPEKMIRIFSSAYNAGYTKSYKDLESNSYTYYFPYGKQGTGEQYSYSEIALDYYNRHQ